MGFLEGLLGFLTGGTVVLAFGALVVIVLFFMTVARVMRWIVKVPPNKALLVYGLRTRSRVIVMRRVPIPTAEGEPTKFKTESEEVVVNYKIVVGGMVLVLPVVHTYKELDLSLMTLEVKVENVLSSQAVPITVDGIAQIKIGSDDTHIATAAEQLLDKDPADIMRVAKETLMGHLRAIIGLMTVEKVYKDREAFAQAVLEVAVDDLRGMGLEIVSFTIKEIEDEKGYLEALGRPEIAAKLRDARIAEANADKNATEKEQDAQKNMAEYIKTTNVAKAHYNAEVAAEEAKAEKAKPISLAEQEKTLETKQAEAAEQAAIRRDKQLDAEERRPADAKLYAAQKEAEGIRATGYAGADVKQKEGEAEAKANKAKGIAEADVLAAKGEADGKAIAAKLLAEAKGKTELVEALNRYGDNAIRLLLTQMFLEGLPQFAGEITKHIAEIDEVRIVDLVGGGGDGERQGVFEQFADQGLRIGTKILQGAPALFADVLDDIIMAMVARKAEEVGVKVEKPEEVLEAPTEEAPTPPKAEEEVPPAPAEEVTHTPKEEKLKSRRRRPPPQRKRERK